MRRPLYSFALDPDLRQALQRVKERDGISESEQIRRGIRMWLETKDVRVEADRKRVSPRKRS